MEVKELRIGNYVHDDFKEVHKVEQLSSDQYKNWIKEPNIVLSKINGLKGFYQSDEVFPIELTEEWLLKLGFEKKAEHNFRLNVFARSIIHAYTHGKVEIELGNRSGYSFGYPQVQYVHQLQNLYFALTGEELEQK